ncbi:para-aminobenzoate synthase [Massarina eburnea CBS 473.64]|uniref:aminodeoxychorismate synthase n=1 Tax=Massarina eburnea CBS 473.64 TaxID=1395130 RepID=A0A6A6RJW0_9PLEO|nr:para-aminobenzoate synthase [Massarina eburnea CBS 473.64]
MGSIDTSDFAAGSHTGKILFVDAFDSFTNNIVGLLEQCLQAEVTLVHINDDKVSENLEETVSHFDAVVVGPGPGHPGIPSDVGFINKLWALDDENILPILGICLGFQSLCLAHGAEVERLPCARHGIVSKLLHNNVDIFAGIGDGFEATQYHSLRVDLLGNKSRDALSHSVFWEPSEACPSLYPLAWDTTDEANGPILMAVRHTTKPFSGVQFHPESICTSEESKQLISNWWTNAQTWLTKRGRARTVHKKQIWEPADILRTGLASSSPDVTPSGSLASSPPTSHLAGLLRSVVEEDDVFLRWEKKPAAKITPTSLIEVLGQKQNEVVLLDSQGHASGNFSIIGLMVPGKTMKVTYKVADKILRYGIDQGQTCTMQLNSIEEVWPMLQEALDLHDPRNQGGSSRASSTSSDMAPAGLDQYVAGHLPVGSPFWGGFMGYISYEAGLETIDVEPHASYIPDINFAFCHRTIVIDHKTSQVYIQSLLPNDLAWILDVGRTVDGLTSRAELTADTADSQKSITDARECATLDRFLSSAQVARPQETSYRDKVLRCQELLASGDSYELCLTDETKISVPAAVNGRMEMDAWALYKRLRSKNAAPFGAFMRLSGVSVVGTSPERFLSWSREGKCQFRPIKGTVKKSKEMTRERAHAILESSKERAENLMIVDLIRHDLSGVIGADKTWVSKLMAVEEYETVYQLVSVIEGQLPVNGVEDGGPRGIDVLKASLPPGSMTGAPKKRSCEILSDIEQRPRGIYSGVLGYMDVGGSGDFSVVIRTAVKTDDQGVNNTNAGINGDPEVWRIGAGGAVTIQSTDESEFQEMETKCSSVLGAIFS